MSDARVESSTPTVQARTPLAPGARVVIRDEEWIVRRLDPSSDGGELLVCDGVSELVRGRTAHFLTKLEDTIEVLDPAETALEIDQSPHFTAGLLHIEALLRRNLPNDDRIRLGHHAVMDTVPYQLDPALQALKQPRQRILIADATGLGKTLEAGILTTELVQRGRGSRILVVTLKSMLEQFQKEFWTRFSIPLVRLDSVGLARVRNRIPANHNPFNYFDRSIISIDTLKNNLEYRNYLDGAWWDIIIIDECHNVAARRQDTGLSLRARLAQRLARRSDALILLSATPHDGSARSFASLMTLLDPTAISDPDDYTPQDYNDKGLVIRRFKKDIRGQITQHFEDREPPLLLRAHATPEEDAAFEALLAVPFTRGGHRLVGEANELLRVSLQKGLFSSPAAAAASLRNRIKTLEGREAETNDSRAELSALSHVLACVDGITPDRFSRYQRLLALLRDSAYAWSPRQDDDRLVIFSERLDTLRWLRGELAEALSLRADESDSAQVVVLDGTLPDTEQMAIVERFGRLADPLRVLLCSDVASEGLNLHHFCHRLVHFDLPWSLMVFQQRNGRIDRYGQTRRPRIAYLLTETTVERVRGDLRILEVLQQKDERASHDLGDPSAFMNLCDPDAEAERVAEVMAARMSPEAFDAQLERDAATSNEDEGDWLLQLFNAPAEATSSAVHGTEELPSLFSDEYRFAKAALEELGRDRVVAQWSPDEDRRAIALTAPADLQVRLRQIPREARTTDDRYVLTVDRDLVKAAIERARQARRAEESWPDLQYLWPQHPVSEWLRDRVVVHFGRHTAPVIRSPHLAADERAILMLGLIPNRKGQPMLVDWKAVVLGTPAGSGAVLELFEHFATRAGLKAGTLPNPAAAINLQSLKGDLRTAVARMERHMAERQAEFASEMADRLETTLARLEALQSKQLQHVQLKFAEMSGPENLRRGRKEQREQQIYRVFDDYKTWVRDSLETEPHPYVQVLAAVCR